MIRVAVIYPSGDDKTFDLDYYLNHHMRMVDELLKPLGMLDSEVDSGVAAGESPQPYTTIGYLRFNTLEDWERAIESAGEQLYGDVPNYTNITPVLQISEIVKDG